MTKPNNDKDSDRLDNRSIAGGNLDGTVTLWNNSVVSYKIKLAAII